MRKTLFLILSMPALALAASIATTPIVPSLEDTDRIPIGRPLGSTAYTTTPTQIRGVLSNFTTHAKNYSNPHAVSASQIGLASYNGSAGFGNISTNAIYIRQGDNAQALELYEAAANGSSTITLAVQDQMSSSRTVVIGNHGLYVDGVQVVTW